jgi:hypothetical protein
MPPACVIHAHWPGHNIALRLLVVPLPLPPPPPPPVPPLALTCVHGVSPELRAHCSGSELYRTLQLRVEVASCLSDLLHINVGAVMAGTHGASIREDVRGQKVDVYSNGMS